MRLLIVNEIFLQDNPPVPEHAHILVKLLDDERSDDSLKELIRSKTVTSTVIDPLLYQESRHVMYRNIGEFLFIISDNRRT